MGKHRMEPHHPRVNTTSSIVLEVAVVENNIFLIGKNHYHIKEEIL